MSASWPMESRTDGSSKHPFGQRLNDKLQHQYGLNLNDEDWRTIILAFLNNGNCTQEIAKALHTALSVQPGSAEKYDELQRKIHEPAEVSGAPVSEEISEDPRGEAEGRPDDFAEKVENLKFMKANGLLDLYAQTIDEIREMAAGGNPNGNKTRYYENYTTSDFAALLNELGE